MPRTDKRHVCSCMSSGCKCMPSYLKQHGAVFVRVRGLNVVRCAGMSPTCWYFSSCFSSCLLWATCQAVAASANLLLLKARVFLDGLGKGAAHTASFFIYLCGCSIRERCTERVVSHGEHHRGLGRALAIQEAQSPALWLVLPKQVDAVVNQGGGGFFVVHRHLATVKHLKLLRVVKGLLSLLLGSAFLFECAFGGLPDAADDLGHLRMKNSLHFSSLKNVKLEHVSMNISHQASPVVRHRVISGSSVSRMTQLHWQEKHWSIHMQRYRLQR